MKVIPTVAVLMCTYNGERFLEEQLCSLAKQTVGAISVYISDDGSSDQTLAIIEQCKVQFPQLTIEMLAGPRMGFANNFLSFFKLNQPPADFIAYADQDDIWEAEKLERAITWLQTIPVYQPGLYGSRTCLVDENGYGMGFSPLFTKKPSFANALVQNIMGGNTMVMNQAAWHLMKIASKSPITSHDLWTYQMITGAGGAIFYDPHPSLRYRQHANNIIGANNSMSARWQRIKLLLKGHLYRQSDIHAKALNMARDLLTPANQQCLDYFMRAHTGRLWERLYAFKKSGIYRQTALGTLALWAAVILRKI